MKSGFKKLSKTELIRLRGGQGAAACCTHTSMNSDCTTNAITCTANPSGVAVSMIGGKAYDKKGKFLKAETDKLAALKLKQSKAPVAVKKP